MIVNPTTKMLELNRDYFTEEKFSDCRKILFENVKTIFENANYGEYKPEEQNI